MKKKIQIWKKSHWFFLFLIHSEDILNYEIGDVDVDDTDLTGADEDELLLSDDGMGVFDMHFVICQNIQLFYFIV